MSQLLQLMNRTRLLSATWVWAMLMLPHVTQADDAFRKRIIPFVKEYCVECHNQNTAEAELDLTRDKSVAMVGAHYRQWEHVITFLRKKEMPPADAKQPSAELRGTIVATLQRLLISESRKLAGDPGTVLPRRLSNAEYNYTIRDLTGIDIRPTDSFPIDPASGEGFNNTGEALRMTPSLFKKYYDAAERVADHLLFKPSGLDFAPFPVVTYADRMKFYEQAIIRFYEKHNVDYDKYLTAAWSYRHRSSESSALTLDQWADRHGLSKKYFRRLWGVLESDSPDRFYLGWIARRWKELPPPADADAAKQQIRTLASDLRRLSLMLCAPETKAIVSNAGNGPIQHIQRRTKTSSDRDTFNETLLAGKRQLHVEIRDLQKQPSIKLFLRVGNPTDSQTGLVILNDLNFSKQPPRQYRREDKKQNMPLGDLLRKHAGDEYRRLQFGKHPHDKAIDSTSFVIKSPSTLTIELPVNAFDSAQSIHFHAQATLDQQHSTGGIVQIALSAHQPTPAEFPGLQFPLVNPEHPDAGRLKGSCRTFCSHFPNRFVYVDSTRGLSAGFHLIEGVFRDDQPLRKLVLSDAQNRTLDRLWDELAFGTGITEKMLRGFVFFERSERNFMKHPDFDDIKEEDPKLIEDKTLSRFRDIYLSRSGVKATGEELVAHPIHRFFESFRSGLKQRDAQLKEAEPIYLYRLEKFAHSAYRRPLTSLETNQLRKFFRDTSRQPEFGIEQAVRASIVRLLVSPHFCYRTDPLPNGDSTKPLSDLSLASRLSYFLWSSMPDSQLRTLAEAGTLQNDTTLRSQLRRMLKDPKMSAFALEFFGQWLGHREFLHQESVNRNVFREFDDELKQAMFQEPTRVITHLIQRNSPVTDLLSSDTTFVNKRLARHYGLPFAGQDGEWVRTTGLRQQGRGGLLGMAVFLTKNSQPERTSPVKRGFWVFHKVLGRHIPAPPPDVAVLPAKETDSGGKTIRELLKLHTDDAKCARCHVRFDPIGLSMEGFDPIGRSRNRDLAGRPVDNLVSLPSGDQARGVPEFSRHLVSQRRNDFLETLCQKLLGYALGRSLLLSDRPLLEKMQTTLNDNEYRLGPLFEVVVSSPQFRSQRCRNFTAAKFRTELQEQ